MNKPFDIRDRLNSRPVHRHIPPTIADDFRDLWAEIVANPTSHAVVGVFGFMAGTFLFLIPAYIGSLFL